MRRFYKSVSTSPVEDGFDVRLDGKTIKTPSRCDLIVPTRALAEAIAGEWREQGETIRPEQMPLTRMANTALDRVVGSREKVVAEIAVFAESDLICYRAELPDDLVAAQEKAWGKYVAWVEERFGIAPVITSGISHVPQPEALIAEVRDQIGTLDIFTVSALHNLTTLSGSVYLALALLDGVAAAEAIWNAAHVDEAFQRARWGEDQEASIKTAADKTLFLAAARLVALMRD